MTKKMILTKLLDLTINNLTINNLTKFQGKNSIKTLLIVRLLIVRSNNFVKIIFCHLFVIFVSLIVRFWPIIILIKSPDTHIPYWSQSWTNFLK